MTKLGSLDERGDLAMRASYITAQVLAAAGVFFLLLVGTCLDPPPAILLLTPILMPIVKDAGIDPIHFGVIMTAEKKYLESEYFSCEMTHPDG